MPQILNIDKDFLYKEYVVNKKTAPEIASILGYNSGTIYSHLKRYNIPLISSFERKLLNNGKMIPCEICGTKKYFAKWEQKQRNYFYCSQPCRYKGMSLFYSGKNAHNYQGGSIEVECSYCHVKLFREKCQINNSGRHYCDDKCMGNYFRENMIGKNHPNFGRKFPQFSKRMKENNPMHNKKTRNKVSKTLKRLFKEGKWSARLGTHHSLESRLKQSLAKGGDGKILVDPRYPGIFGKTLKKKIKNRDDNTCQCCFKTENQEIKDIGRGLSVHHIDYNKFNCSETNLITVCLCCNNRANGTKDFDRDYWYAYYTYLINKKYMIGVI